MNHILRSNRPRVNEEPAPPQDPLRYRVHIACYETPKTPRVYRILAFEDGTMITRLSRELTRELLEMALVLTNYGPQEREKFKTEEGETFVFVYHRKYHIAPVAQPTYRDDNGWRVCVRDLGDLCEKNTDPFTFISKSSRKTTKHPYA